MGPAIINQQHADNNRIKLLYEGSAQAAEPTATRGDHEADQDEHD